MAKLRTHPFDAAEFLDTPGAIAAYLSDALASGSDAEFVAALNVAIRAYGLTLIAKDAGVSRQDICHALREAAPEIEVAQRLVAALGGRGRQGEAEEVKGTCLDADDLYLWICGIPHELRGFVHWT